MSNSDLQIPCSVCKKGHLIIQTEPISFSQKTDKGTVFCSTILPINICEHCGTKSWDRATEALVEEAVRREYEKLA
jgi:hypothetical protein